MLGLECVCNIYNLQVFIIDFSQYSDTVPDKETAGHTASLGRERTLGVGTQQASSLVCSGAQAAMILQHPG